MRRGVAILVLAASVAAEPFALVGLREDTRPAKDGALRVGLDFLMPDGKKQSRSILIQDAVMRRELLSSGTPFLFPETAGTAFLVIQQPRQVFGVRLSWEHNADVAKSFRMALPLEVRSRPIRTSESSFALLGPHTYVYCDLKVPAVRQARFWYQPFSVQRTRNLVFVSATGKAGVEIGYRRFDVCNPPLGFKKAPSPFRPVADVGVTTQLGAVNPDATRVVVSEEAKERSRFVLTVSDRGEGTLVRRSFAGRLFDLRWTDNDHLILTAITGSKTELLRLDVTKNTIDRTPIDPVYIATPAFVPAALLPKPSPG